VRSNFIIHVLVLLVLAGLLFCANLFWGAMRISFADLSDPTASVIFYQIRLPKALTAIFAGASLALCGTLMQTLFRNPLAGPYVLGISSGASLFVAISMMLMSTMPFSEL
jgi:iron complex transport system permease protein